MYVEIALIAYVVDRVFGEFSFIRHPVIIMGGYIKWFEKKFYKDSIGRGFVLTASLLLITTLTLYCFQLAFENIIIIPEYLTLLILSTVASTTIASKMLYDSVKEIIINPKKITYLVSRDTEDLNRSDINKAAIETYAENLSDGVIAPLFYLLLFGLYGAFIYKAINTLDSMTGYRSERYENFGKFAAKLDDIANYIPARFTALLIALLMGSKKTTGNERALTNFYRYGKKHESPNAGHPIASMALAIDVKLGGNTSYFGEIKPKACFGDGKEEITLNDITNALSFQARFDILVLIVLGSILWV